MRGMILAAGRGTRMGEMMRDVPKPLLRLQGQYLIEYSIEALIAADIREIVINVSHLSEQIELALGDGSRYGVKIFYSKEATPLETGGGIFQALPLLEFKPFIVLSADVVSDYPLLHLTQALSDSDDRLAHLVFVDNPDFHPEGDYCLSGRQVSFTEGQRLTYGNIGVFSPRLFSGRTPGKFRLAEVLAESIDKNKITGEYFQGVWHNIGTPKDLEKAHFAVL